VLEWLSSVVIFGSSLMQNRNAARQREQNADRDAREGAKERRRLAEQRHAIERNERNAQVQRDAQPLAAFALVVSPDRFLRDALLWRRTATVTISAPSTLAPSLDRRVAAALPREYVSQLWRPQLPITDVTATSVFEHLHSIAFVAAELVPNGPQLDLRACAWGPAERDPRVRRVGEPIPVGREDDGRPSLDGVAAVVAVRLAVLSDRVSRPSPLRSLDVITRLAPIVPPAETADAIRELVTMLLAAATVDVVAGANVAVTADTCTDRGYARSIFSAFANRYVGRAPDAGSRPWSDLVADLERFVQTDRRSVAALAATGVRLHISEFERLLARALREGVTE
jgi:hypothetical protein